MDSFAGQQQMSKNISISSINIKQGNIAINILMHFLPSRMYCGFIFLLDTNCFFKVYKVFKEVHFVEYQNRCLIILMTFMKALINH